MPAYDGTGPQGCGPMSGCGTGRCNASDSPRGFGRGMRKGRRFGFFGQPANPVSEQSGLENEVISLRSQLEEMQNKLEKLELRSKE